MHAPRCCKLGLRSCASCMQAFIESICRHIYFACRFTMRVGSIGWLSQSRCLVIAHLHLRSESAADIILSPHMQSAPLHAGVLSGCR